MVDTQSKIIAKLKAHGAMCTVLPSGKRLFIVSAVLMGMSEPGIMISIERDGCYFWDGKTRVTDFNLMGAGFQMQQASVIASVLNALYDDPADNGPREEPETRKPERIV